MASSVASIRIEPVDVNWEIEEQWCITTVADSSGSLDGTFITLSESAGSVSFWSDNGDSGTTIPAGASAADRAVEITTFADDDSASTIATKLAAAIDADGSFSASAVDDVVTVTASAVGDFADWADGDMGFSFSQAQEGGSIDLGLLDGDVEVSFEEETFEVMAHQTGTTLRADLRQGVSASVSLTLKQSDNPLRKEILAKAAGGVFTPSGGTELYGWGDSRQGLNTVVQARRLIFNFLALGSGDRSRDLCFWKAYPLPESITFSGENPEIMAVNF